MNIPWFRCVLSRSQLLVTATHDCWLGIGIQCCWHDHQLLNLRDKKAPATKTSYSSIRKLAAHDRISWVQAFEGSICINMELSLLNMRLQSPMVVLLMIMCLSTSCAGLVAHRPLSLFHIFKHCCDWSLRRDMDNLVTIWTYFHTSCWFQMVTVWILRSNKVEYLLKRISTPVTKRSLMMLRPGVFVGAAI